MPRGNSFKTVEAIGRTLPDVEVTTAYGQPALKVRGRMIACMAANKAAEPNTLVVMMEFADRDALIEDDPDTYYLKDHYLNYPCVLVRLSSRPAGRSARPRGRRAPLRDGEASEDDEKVKGPALLEWPNR